MQYFLTVLTFFICVSVGWAKSSPETPHIAFETISTQTTDGVVLKGVRLANEGGTKVLLLHGFAENTRIFREAGNALHAMGYDVYEFNMRGHGNGEQLSQNPTVSVHSNTGFYSFDNWVTKDVPAAIDYVSPHDEKIIVLGHSLGGAALRVFLSGVRSRKNQDSESFYLTSDTKKIEKYASRVAVLHTIGSPTSFHSQDSIKLVVWSLLPSFLQKIGSKVFAMNKETYSEKNGIKASEILQEAIHRTIYKAGGYNGVIGPNMKMSLAEIARMFRKAFTYDIPQDLVDDVMRWLRGSFNSRSGQSYEELTVPSKIRFVQTVGRNDGLAPAENIIADTIRGRYHHTPEMVIMKTHEHLDIISGQDGGGRIAAIVREKDTGTKVRYSGMIRRILNFPERCTLYFAN